jgi:hypothetical protein
MSPSAIAFIVFACLFGGALLGMSLRQVLPKHHLSDDSKHLLEVGIGVIGTMAALVLGLLVGSASSSFNAQNNEVIGVSAKVVLLDRLLAHYGTEAKPSRTALKDVIVRGVDRLWPQERSAKSQVDPGSGFDTLFGSIEELSPRNDMQRSLKPQALAIVTDLGQTRWLIFAQQGTAISLPLLVVVVFWFTTTFVGFGLFAPRNATVIATLFVCSLSVSGAIFLVLEMSTPFGGLIDISSDPMRSAIAQLSR